MVVWWQNVSKSVKDDEKLLDFQNEEMKKGWSWITYCVSLQLLSLIGIIDIEVYSIDPNDSFKLTFDIEKTWSEFFNDMLHICSIISH